MQYEDVIKFLIFIQMIFKQTKHASFKNIFNKQNVFLFSLLVFKLQMIGYDKIDFLMYVNV
jgi:hypothetical protein